MSWVCDNASCSALGKPQKGDSESVYFATICGTCGRPVEPVGARGRCGEPFPSITPQPSPPLFCELLHGHPGWHRADETEWSANG